MSGDVLEAALSVWAQMGSQHAIPVSGQSMWPTIRDGDRVWVAHGCVRVRRGDVIVYRRGGGLVVHRVISAQGSGEQRQFVTRGDNSGHADAPVEANQVVGQVIAIEHRGRTRRLPSGGWRWLGWGAAWAVARLYRLRSKTH